MSKQMIAQASDQDRRTVDIRRHFFSADPPHQHKLILTSWWTPANSSHSHFLDLPEQQVMTAATEQLVRANKFAGGSERGK